MDLKNILKRIVKSIFYVKRFAVIEGPLDDPIPVPDPPQDISIRYGTHDDWGMLRPFLAEAYGEGPLERFRSWIEGDFMTCLLGLRDGKLVYNSWIAFEDYYDDYFELTVKVESHQAFAIAGYTPPGLRGKGMHGATHARLLLAAKEKGRRCVCWYMAGDVYRKAMASYERYGFRQDVVGTAYYLRLFGTKRLLVRRNGGVL